MVSEVRARPWKTDVATQEHKTSLQCKFIYLITKYPATVIIRKKTIDIGDEVAFEVYSKSVFLSVLGSRKYGKIYRTVDFRIIQMDLWYVFQRELDQNMYLSHSTV